MASDARCRDGCDGGRRAGCRADDHKRAGADRAARMRRGKSS